MAKKPKKKDLVEKRRVNLRPSQWELLREWAYLDGTTISYQVRRAVHFYLTDRHYRRTRTQQRKKR